jgi:hypothetical protein
VGGDGELIVDTPNILITTLEIRGRVKADVTSEEN